MFKYWFGARKTFALMCMIICFTCMYDKAFNSPYPIQFSIPENKVVSAIPEKDRDFAFIIPGNLSTYIYQNEFDYYKDYQRSYYAITCCKGGWDCMRHYEILANGCIPYFLDLDKCNSNTMYFLPKDLIKEAMSLPGVSYLNIDHEKFDKVRYYEILNKLLEHTKKYLTTRNMAHYILDTIHYKGTGKILYLSQQVLPDYMREVVLIGMKEIFPQTVIDYPKIDYIYKSYVGDISQLYGKGFTYTRIIDDIPVDRSNIVERIKAKEFDLIVYGSVHRGLPFHELVCNTYPADKIVYVCGEDLHGVCPHSSKQNLFLREFVLS